MLWQAPPVRLLTSNSDQSKAWRLGGGTGLFSTHKLTVRAARVACSGNMTALNCHWLHETATEAGGGVAPVCQSGLQSLKSFHFNYLLQLMIQDMMSSRLYMCFSIKDRCANMQTNDMKEDTGDSNSGDEYMHTSTAAVCMWQCFQCGEHESHMSTYWTTHLHNYQSFSYLWDSRINWCGYAFDKLSLYVFSHPILVIF